MFKFELVNNPSFQLDNEVISNIMESVERSVSASQNWILNIVFVGDEYMKKLNLEYRWKNSTTDVLSFHYFDDFSWVWEDEVSWEILLSESKILLQAKEYGLWEKKETYKLIIHSALHILGYDHEEDDDYKEMQSLEDKIWQEIFGKN